MEGTFCPFRLNMRMSKRLGGLFLCCIYSSILACQPLVFESDVTSEESTGLVQLSSIIDYGHYYLDSLCNQRFEGRKAGTDGWKRAYSFLCTEVSRLGYSPDIQTIRTEKGTDIYSLIITLPGDVDSTIIIGAHYDGAIQSSSGSHHPAANDNASGTVTLLMLLKDLSVNHLETDKTISIILWGCEEYFEGRPFRASWEFTHTMSDLYKSQVLLYVNIDTMGHHNDENKMLLEHSIEKRVLSEVDSIKTNGRFDYVTRARLTDMYSDFYSFFEVGIPYINIHDYCVPVCEHPVHSIIDSQDFISVEQLYNVTQDIRGIITTY